MKYYKIDEGTLISLLEEAIRMAFIEEKENIQWSKYDISTHDFITQAITRLSEFKKIQE